MFPIRFKPITDQLLRLIRYWVHMDEHGDAEGNYTLLSIDPARPPGLYPLAVLHKSSPVMYT